MDYSAIINPIIEDWITDFLLDLQDRAREKIGTDTGAGANSIDAAVIKATAQSGAQIAVSMSAHLRMYDMRKTQRESNLAHQELEEIKAWIERKGVNNFLAKYKYPTTVTKGGVTTPVPMKRIINNIAWGISRKKGKLKRKKWYNRYKGKQTYRLYAKLLDAVIDASMDGIKESLAQN